MALRTIDALELGGKRVFIRVDFNVPIDEHGKVGDDQRIRASLPTVKYALGKKARVILASHLGRPKGKPEDKKKYTLLPVAERLQQLLDQDVTFADDCTGDGVKKLVKELKDGQVLLLENLRFHPEEEGNGEAFAKELASLADVWVNEDPVMMGHLGLFPFRMEVSEELEERGSIFQSTNISKSP